jgi:1-acyl-sn-glycerol-3-phosphate acyltransferase
VIVAEPHPIFTPFWVWYILQSVRGHFDAVRVHVAAPDATPTPTLWHATHVSWWDGYLALTLARHLNLEFRVMMLEENLSKYRFLRFAGAFGLPRGSARGTLESFRYAVQELGSVPPRAVLMFPAGEIGSPHARPAPYEAGASSLALHAAKVRPVHVRAVAIRLEHLGAAKPTAFLRVSEPRVVRGDLNTQALTALMRADLERETDALQNDLATSQLEGYVAIMRGRSSVQEGWDGFRRLLGFKV